MTSRVRPAFSAAPALAISSCGLVSPNARARAVAVLGVATLSCGLVEPGRAIGSSPPVDAWQAPADAARARESGSRGGDAGGPDVAQGRDSGVDAAFDSWVAPPETGPDGSADALSVDAVVDTGHDPPSEAGQGDGGRMCFDECPVEDIQCVSVCDDGACMTRTLKLTTCALTAEGCAAWSTPATCLPAIACCTFDGPLGPLGTPCTQDEDCNTDACDGVTHPCTHSQCSDHRQDGDETDIDCGGSECSACASGQGCNLNFDCQSGLCLPATHKCMDVGGG